MCPGRVLDRGDPPVGRRRHAGGHRHEHVPRRHLADVGRERPRHLAAVPMSPEPTHEGETATMHSRRIALTVALQILLCTSYAHAKDLCFNSTTRTASANSPD